MSHLEEGDLVLLYYDEAPATARDHVEACPECGDALARLRSDLDAVVAEDPPPRAEDYEAALWARLAPGLEAVSGGRTARPVPRRPRVWSFAALAASLVAAFAVGRYTAAPVASPPSPSSTAGDAAARERILLVAVGDHLERSEVLLVELVNADPARPGEPSVERSSAEALLATNRLVRQSATQAGDAAVADLLGELERVLAEVAHGDGPQSADLASVRRRIERRGLLFKVRVLGTRLREKEKPAEVL